MAVGILEVAGRYITRCSANDDSTDGEVPPGFTPVEVAGISATPMESRQRATYGMETEQEEPSLAVRCRSLPE